MPNTIAIALLTAGVFLLQGPKAMGQAANAARTSETAETQASIEKDIELLRKDLRAQKKQLIAANLKLTDADAVKFWPLYDQYQAEYRKIGDAKMSLLKDYAENWGTVSDEQAVTYLKRSQEIDESVLQLRNKYVAIFAKVLPGKKLATFFQLDRRIDELMNLQMVSQIPLVQEQSQ